MPNQMSDRQRGRFLDGRRVAVLTTIGRNGGPLQTPIWYVHRDGVFYFQTGAGTAKEQNIRRDGRVSICVQDERPPYRAVIATGTAELSDEIEWLAEELPRRYLGFVGAIGYRATAKDEIQQGETVVIKLKPGHVTTSDFGRETPFVGRVWLGLRRVLPKWL